LNLFVCPCFVVVVLFFYPLFCCAAIFKMPTKQHIKKSNYAEFFNRPEDFFFIFPTRKVLESIS
jgi:hypothetical protein